MIGKIVIATLWTADSTKSHKIPNEQLIPFKNQKVFWKQQQ